MRKYKRGKNSRIKKLLAGTLVLCMGMVLWAGCGSQSEEKQTSQEETASSGKEEDKIQIGLTVDSFVIERWIRDRDVFVALQRAGGRGECSGCRGRCPGADQPDRILYQ